MENAESAFSAGRFDEAFGKYSEIIKNQFSVPRDIAISQCRLGIIESVRDKAPEAKRLIEESIRSGNVPKKYRDLCGYALLQLYVLAQSNVEARDLVEKLGELGLPPLYVARTHALAAEVARRLKDSRSEVLHLQKLLAAMERAKLQEIEIKILAGSKISQAELRKRLGIETVEPVKPTATPTPFPKPTRFDAPKQPAEVSVIREAEKLKNGGELPQNGFASVLDFVLDRMAKGLYKEALSALESHALEKYDEGLFSNRIFPRAKLLARTQRLVEDNPKDVRVGIVLPSGPAFSRFNSRILKGISAFANSSATQGVNYSYFIRSVRGDSGSAETAALSLILDDHVHTIVGAYTTSIVFGVKSIAETLGVPVFSFGPIPAAKDLNSVFVIRMGILSKSQGKLLTKHLHDDLGFQSVAILAPGDAYGFEMAEALQDAAKELGLKVSQRVFYDPQTTEFREITSKMLGGEVHDREYLEAVERAKKRATEEKRKLDLSGIKAKREVLFDALFVPDSFSKLQLISTSFAYNSAPEVRYVSDKQAIFGLGNQTVADQFLNGARFPILTKGSFHSYLLSELGVESQQIDLERQAFDALMFMRQAQYSAAGSNGRKILAALFDEKMRVDGAFKYGNILSGGEPLANFSLVGYRAGQVSDNLVKWDRRNIP